jgi:glutathione synthase/RimK-type ligase-like ATP-grasp enzyme
MRFFSEKPVAVLYEHPRWFNPLFHELDGRGISFIKINPDQHVYDPAERTTSFGLVYNDLSLSLSLSNAEKIVTSRAEYLRNLEGSGVSVINGVRALEAENTKVRQLSLFKSLDLKFPATRVVSSPDAILPAAEQLGFPVVVKSNHRSGGSVTLYETSEELNTAFIDGSLNFSFHHVLVLQKFIPPKGNHIVRVETLNGKFIYALKIFVTGEKLNIWPLEVKMEVYTPPLDIIQAVEAVVRSAGIEAGSVEYITDRRNNRNYFFDINAHPVYSIDVRNVLGYDPYTRLVDYIEHRLRKIREIELAL